ncbi:heme biosynthesis HemY N-terminal domain-containing protein [Allohahella sp. A8]|uniref:heme biosynthesis HemY N-terminal domain-containing protein n=1 Tax=Allohahella sp. A8 TaxID=3141461 RepID=UPI003A80BFA6
MSRLLIYILLAIAVGLGLGYLVQLDPGYIRISWMSYLVETTVWIALILIVLTILLVQLVLKTLFALLATREGFRSWREGYADSRAHKRTQRGLLDFAEGRWDRAERRLVNSADKSEAPMMSYLTAAQAASEQGDIARSNQLLNQAKAVMPNSDFAVELTKAQMYVARDQFEEAKALLLQLNSRRSGHSAVLRLLRQCMLETGDWAGLVKLLPEIEKYCKLTEDQMNGLRQSAWFNWLDSKASTAGISVDNSAHGSTGTDVLDGVWNSLPQQYAQHPVFIRSYVSGLMRAGSLGQAVTVLRKALTRNWNGDLGLLYVKAASASGDAEQAYADLSQWRAGRDEDPDLLLALGIAAERSGNLDEARACLEKSLQSRESSDTYGALGRVANRQGDFEAGSHMLELALQHDQLEKRMVSRVGH